MTLDGTVLQQSADLIMLRVMFDAKMTLGKHLRSVSIAVVQRLGIIRHANDRSLWMRSFWSFVLPVM